MKHGEKTRENSLDGKHNRVMYEVFPQLLSQGTASEKLFRRQNDRSLKRQLTPHHGYTTSILVFVE